MKLSGSQSLAIVSRPCWSAKTTAVTFHFGTRLLSTEFSMRKLYFTFTKHILGLVLLGLGKMCKVGF